MFTVATKKWISYIKPSCRAEVRYPVFSGLSLPGASGTGCTSQPLENGENVTCIYICVCVSYIRIHIYVLYAIYIYTYAYWRTSGSSPCFIGSHEKISGRYFFSRGPSPVSAAFLFPASKASYCGTSSRDTLHRLPCWCLNV